jgi:hypothetical protein
VLNSAPPNNIWGRHAEGGPNFRWGGHYFWNLQYFPFLDYQTLSVVGPQILSVRSARNLSYLVLQDTFCFWSAGLFPCLVNQILSALGQAKHFLFSVSQTLPVLGQSNSSRAWSIKCFLRLVNQNTFCFWSAGLPCLVDQIFLWLRRFRKICLPQLSLGEAFISKLTVVC